MSYEGFCADCDRPISVGYERCYTCNEEYNATSVIVAYDGEARTTDKAVGINAGAGLVWLPRSQVIGVNADSREVYLPRWLADERGLDYVVP